MIQIVNLFNSVLKDIFHHSIPHEIITCKAKDPPWMTKEIKTSLRRKNRLYKKYISKGMNETDRLILDKQSLLCDSLITESKNRYVSNLTKKLNDPLTSHKAYWSTLNRFIGRGKIPNIPPLEVRRLV